MSRLMLLACQVLVAVVGLALWQLLTTVPVFGRILLPPFFFSNPVDVGSQIVDWFVRGTIWKHLMITLTESILAFTIGSAAGIAVGFAVVGAVVGEYLGSAAGLGYLIQQAEGTFDVAGVFAGMFVLAAFVIMIDWLVTLVENRLLVWRPVAAETRT